MSGVTEERLRGMGVNADQRKKVMAAAKLGLGPLASMGLSEKPAFVAPAPTRQAQLASPAPGPRQASPRVSAAAAEHKKKAEEEEPADLDGFLAGGKKTARLLKNAPAPSQPPPFRAAPASASTPAAAGAAASGNAVVPTPAPRPDLPNAEPSIGRAPLAATASAAPAPTAASAPSPQAERRGELEAMRQSQLRKAARSAGIPQDTLDDAEDAVDAKRAIIELVLHAEAAPAGAHCKAKSAADAARQMLSQAMSEEARFEAARRRHFEEGLGRPVLSTASAAEAASAAVTEEMAMAMLRRAGAARPLAPLPDAGELLSELGEGEEDGRIAFLNEQKRKAKTKDKKKKKARQARQQQDGEVALAEEDPEAHGVCGKEDEDQESSEEQRRRRTAGRDASASLVKNMDESKRKFWGESVKGKMSNDYKGWSDADLERRFMAQQKQSNGERLMSEEEVKALIRRARSRSRGKKR